VPEAVLGHASAAVDSDHADSLPLPRDPASARSLQIFMFGGLSGRVTGAMVRIDLPSDLCSLWNESPHFCRITPGCGYCKVYDEPDDVSSKVGAFDSERGKTYCVSNSSPSPNV
jgi:hypothetical protein